MTEYKVGQFLRDPEDTLFKILVIHQEIGDFIQVDLKEMISDEKIPVWLHMQDEDKYRVVPMFSTDQSPYETYFMIKDEFENMRQEIDDMKARLDSHEKD